MQTITLCWNSSLKSSPVLPFWWKSVGRGNIYLSELEEEEEGYTEKKQILHTHSWEIKLQIIWRSQLVRAIFEYWYLQLIGSHYKLGHVLKSGEKAEINPDEGQLCRQGSDQIRGEKVDHVAYSCSSAKRWKIKKQHYTCTKRTTNRDNKQIFKKKLVKKRCRKLKAIFCPSKYAE